MNKNELYLKTLFCCSACDGYIAPEEVALVRSIVDSTDIIRDIDVEGLLNEYVSQINDKGISFLKDYLFDLSESILTTPEQLELIGLAIKMIEADNQIEFSEIKFFKKIRACLYVSDSDILSDFPEAENYLLPDLSEEDKEIDWSSINFSPICFSIKE